MLPEHAIDALRQSLKGEQLVAQSPESLQIIDSPQHGQVKAVLDTMKRLRIADLIHARPCAERDRVMAMIAARVIELLPLKPFRDRSEVLPIDVDYLTD